MEQTPKISVIVPVYNVEEYLSRCIDSILSQTFTDFELLLIDDGSTDNSGNICDTYALKDNRIRVFHKKNGGVSSARNLGLDNAKGKWIVFIDSDDYISKDFLSFNSTEEVDVIQKPYIIKKKYGKEEFHPLKELHINNKKDLFKFYVNNRDNALWNKIISSNLIKGRRFKEDVKIGEDFLFFLSLLNDIKSYKFCNIGLYIYQIRENSAMQTIEVVSRINILFQNIKNIKDITSQQDISNIGNCIIYHTYIRYLWKLRKFLNKRQKQAFQIELKNLDSKNLEYLTLLEKIKFPFRKGFYLLFSKS